MKSKKKIIIPVIIIAVIVIFWITGQALSKNEWLARVWGESSPTITETSAPADN